MESFTRSFKVLHSVPKWVLFLMIARHSYSITDRFCSRLILCLEMVSNWNNVWRIDEWDNCTKGSWGLQYIGSLFRVDEPVTDDSLTHATPQCMESFCFTNRIFLIVIYRVKEKDTKISLPRKE